MFSFYLLFFIAVCKPGSRFTGWLLRWVCWSWVLASVRVLWVSVIDACVTSTWIARVLSVTVISNDNTRFLFSGTRFILEMLFLVFFQWKVKFVHHVLDVNCEDNFTCIVLNTRMPVSAFFRVILTFPMSVS